MAPGLMSNWGGKTTAVTQLVVLSPGFKSIAALLATTRLLTKPVTGAVTVSCKLVAAPLAKVGIDQTTFVKLPLVVPPPVALRNTKLAGKVSVTTKLVAEEGPPLVIVSE